MNAEGFNGIPKFIDPDLGSSSILPVQDVVVYATAAVTAGDWLQIDTAVTNRGVSNAVKQATVAQPTLWRGVALETLTAAGITKMRVKGVCPGVNVLDAGVSAGSILGPSGATAGRAKLGVNTDTVTLGVALVDETGSDKWTVDINISQVVR